MGVKVHKCVQKAINQKTHKSLFFFSPPKKKKKGPTIVENPNPKNIQQIENPSLATHSQAKPPTQAPLPLPKRETKG